MNKKISILIFLICSVFVLMGLGTILTGDVAGNRESLFMAAYLGFFLTVMTVNTLVKYSRKSSAKH